MMVHVPGDWLVSVAAFYAYSAAVQTMPRPRPDERWYGWIYGFLQIIGANIKDALNHRDSVVTTTSVKVIKQDDATIVNKVEEVTQKEGK